MGEGRGGRGRVKRGERQVEGEGRGNYKNVLYHGETDSTSISRLDCALVLCIEHSLAEHSSLGEGGTGGQQSAAGSSVFELLNITQNSFTYVCYIPSHLVLVAFCGDYGIEQQMISATMCIT